MELTDAAAISNYQKISVVEVENIGKVQMKLLKMINAVIEACKWLLIKGAENDPNFLKRITVIKFNLVSEQKMVRIRIARAR